MKFKEATLCHGAVIRVWDRAQAQWQTLAAGYHLVCSFVKLWPTHPPDLGIFLDVRWTSNLILSYSEMMCKGMTTFTFSLQLLQNTKRKFILGKKRKNKNHPSSHQCRKTGNICCESPRPHTFHTLKSVGGQILWGVVNAKRCSINVLNHKWINLGIYCFIT